MHTLNIHFVQCFPVFKILKTLVTVQAQQYNRSLFERAAVEYCMSPGQMYEMEQAAKNGKCFTADCGPYYFVFEPKG